MGNSILDIFFPLSCLGCQKEGTYLCQDCLACLDVSDNHREYKSNLLDDLYFALPYQGSLIKKMVHQLKNEPLIKELSKALASLIITHFQLINKELDPSQSVLIPLPSSKKRLRWRGFNHSEEIAKEISISWNIPLVSDCLIKTKETPHQTEVSLEERKENIRGAFQLKDPFQLEDKKILLVDDIFSTGSTIKEAARILRQAKVKEIIGIVVARE